MTWLEDAARLTDRLDQLEVELANSGGYMVKGVAGQPVINPIIPEIRQARALGAQMLARITVTPPEEKQSGSVFTLTAGKAWCAILGLNQVMH